MVIILKSKSGKQIKENIEESLSLEQAQEKYSNNLFKVVGIEKEEEGEYSNEDARSMLYNEGIDYAIRRYVGGDAFIDPKTARLWNEADNALNNLLDYLRYDQWESNL